MKNLLILLLKGYQRVLSPDQGVLRHLYTNGNQHCVMYPSCSTYMMVSIEKHGAWTGFMRGIKRILRCNPKQKKLIDLP